MTHNCRKGAPTTLLARICGYVFRIIWLPNI